MDLKALYNQTIANGGISVDRNGDSVALTEGFLVSHAGYESKIKDLTFSDFCENLLGYGHLLNSDPLLWGSFIGFWYDSTSGFWYVDVSDRIEDKGIAYRLGKYRNQLAIYDLASKCAISL